MPRRLRLKYAVLINIFTSIALLQFIGMHQALLEFMGLIVVVLINFSILSSYTNPNRHVIVVSLLQTDILIT